MPYLGRFKEKYGGDYPSIYSLTGYKYENKEKVLRYLTHANITAAAPGSAVDIISGEKIRGELLAYSDGEYEWTSTVPFYVERYNLKLPDEFIKKIMKEKAAG